MISLEHLSAEHADAKHPDAEHLDAEHLDPTGDRLDPESRALLDGLDAVGLDAKTFDHRAHVQVAWAALREGPDLDTASRRIERGLQALAAGAGAPEKYDAELTRAWMRRLDAALQSMPAASWAEFAASNPELFARSTRAA